MRRMDDEMAQAGLQIMRPGAAPGQDDDIPTYLRETYTWAYLSRTGTAIFDHQPVVNAILWGNARRLVDAALAEVREGNAVLQPACVYGTFSRDLAQAVGPRGRLVISDVAPIQLALTRRKVAGLPQVTLARCDASRPGRGPFDVVICFFLLHEVPAGCRRGIVDALLGAARSGGKVVFVDYHRPRSWHPLRPVMGAVFSLLEPFAMDLWQSEIRDHASRPEVFSWNKETFFGGLYQKVVAMRV